MEDVKKLYACSYKEVLTILSFLSDDEWNKIPKEKKDFYFEAMDKDYQFDIDLEKPLNEQRLLEPTKAILANVFRDYLATSNEKKIIFNRELKENEQIEAEKREKYNPDDLFKKAKVQNENFETVNEEKLDMVVYKENFVTKIIRKFKNIFSRFKK